WNYCVSRRTKITLFICSWTSYFFLFPFLIPNRVLFVMERSGRTAAYACTPISRPLSLMLEPVALRVTTLTCPLSKARFVGLLTHCRCKRESPFSLEQERL